jgi:hypothetical protein
MKRGRRKLTIIALLFIGCATLAVVLEPTGTVRALFAGEPFYNYRPLRHWREVLREQGQQGSIAKDLWWRFANLETSLPILLGCSEDSDRNVRWPAIALLGEYGKGRRQVLDRLIEAVKDEDKEVRLQAILALASWGKMSRPAIPALVDSLRDKEHQVGHVADAALWEIDVPAAMKASDWKSYPSSPWSFSVTWPGEPEISQRPGQPEGVIIHSFATQHRIGSEKSPTRYVVSVSDYPEEFVQSSTDQERIKAAFDSMPFGSKKKVVSDREVVISGRKGREQTIEVEGMGLMRIRLVWSGCRMYNILFASQRQFLNAKAANYFLDSFRIEEAP